MFSTVAGGFELSTKLGHESKPGDANWMAAAYSYVAPVVPHENVKKLLN